jgi:hypothetical protein
MANLEDMIEEVLLNLEGYVGDQDIYGTIALPTPELSQDETAWNADDETIISDGQYGLNTTNGQYKRGDGFSLWSELTYVNGWNSETGVDETASEFIVAGPAFQTGSGFSTGIVEVGQELVYVQSIDSTTGLFSGVLRGFRGTTAVEHAAGVRVRNNPRFPIIAVTRAINDTITSLYPKVYAVKTTEITVKGYVAQYDMPANTNGIISVYYKKPGAAKVWLPSKRWNFDNTGASNSSTGKCVNIYDAVAGYPVQVVYTVNPSKIQIGEDYSTVTGLPEYTRDVVVLGACWRLASFVESARIANDTAEQSIMNAQSPSGTPTNLAKYFLGMFTQRLQEAQERQKTEFLPQKHFLR